MALDSLPIELLQLIYDHLDKPLDVCSLRLSCTRCAVAGLRRLVSRISAMVLPESIDYLKAIAQHDTLRYHVNHLDLLSSDINYGDAECSILCEADVQLWKQLCDGQARIREDSENTVVNILREVMTKFPHLTSLQISNLMCDKTRICPNIKSEKAQEIQRLLYQLQDNTAWSSDWPQDDLGTFIEAAFSAPDVPSLSPRITKITLRLKDQHPINDPLIESNMPTWLEILCDSASQLKELNISFIAIYERWLLDPGARYHDPYSSWFPSKAGPFQHFLASCTRLSSLSLELNPSHFATVTAGIESGEESFLSEDGSPPAGMAGFSEVVGLCILPHLRIFHLAGISITGEDLLNFYTAHKTSLQKISLTNITLAAHDYSHWSTIWISISQVLPGLKAVEFGGLFSADDSYCAEDPHFSDDSYFRYFDMDDRLSLMGSEGKTVVIGDLLMAILGPISRGVLTDKMREDIVNDLVGFTVTSWSARRELEGKIRHMNQLSAIVKMTNVASLSNLS